MKSPHRSQQNQSRLRQAGMGLLIFVAVVTLTILTTPLLQAGPPGQENTPTPSPTMTPTATPSATATLTPTLTPYYVVATATPENVVTLAARLVLAEAVAESQGTSTPLPPNATVVRRRPSGSW